MKGIVAQIPIDKQAKPVALPLRKTPIALEEPIKEKIDDLLAKGIIEKSTKFSAWQSPLVFSTKPDGSVRICVDMRCVNQAILRQPQPFPTIDHLAVRLQGTSLFSRLDIAEAFHQVELDEESRDLTTFITPQGTFRYTRLMFGLSNAPELFQRIMQFILRGLEGVLVYLDDIIVYGPNKEEHDRRLRLVLNRLDYYKVRLNVEKCEFRKSSLIFLGYIITPEGILPSQSKINALKKIQRLSCKEEVQSFLGMVSYLGNRYIPNLADITLPLRNLTHKGTHFEWNSIHQEAFDKIIKELTNATMLGYYSQNDVTRLYADASPYGLGAVLVQMNKEGVVRPIAFGSKSLTETEKVYSQTEKEALSLIWAVEHFDFYLRGRNFELYTDHKPLEVIFGPKSTTSARIERWLMRIQAYRFKVLLK